VLRNLRSRLTFGVLAVLTVVLVAAGALVGGVADRTDRDSLDDRLRRTSELLDVAASQALQEGTPDLESDRRLNSVLRATGSSLRVTFQGEGLPGLANGAPFPKVSDLPLGFSTRERDGRRWRFYVKELPASGDDVLSQRIEAASPLGPLEERQGALRRKLVLIGLAVLLATGIGTWLSADLVLRPLRRLRAAAAGIASDDDLERRVPVAGPEELRALSRSFNAMLERLGRSAAERHQALAATRRFAADAGHELRTPLTSIRAALSVIERHPEIDPDARAAMVGDALAENRRLVLLLDGLQALARGDANPVERADVDLAGVVEEACSAAAARHPGTTLRTALPERLVVRGWEPGLRLLVDNLVENAARHGRPDGTIAVALRRDPDGAASLVVDDDGPGVPEEDRARVFEPFARGSAVERPGSGLGLALVAQQARHHGAQVTIGDSPLGGARFAVRVPAVAADDRSTLGA